MAAAPPVLDVLIARFDPSAFDAPAGRARLRLSVDDAGDWDFVVRRGARRLEPAGFPCSARSYGPREPLSNSLFHSGLMSAPSFRR